MHSERGRCTTGRTPGVPRRGSDHGSVQFTAIPFIGDSRLAARIGALRLCDEADRRASTQWVEQVRCQFRMPRYHGAADDRETRASPAALGCRRVSAVMGETPPNSS
jgi:hypothetical protein